MDYLALYLNKLPASMEKQAEKKFEPLDVVMALMPLVAGYTMPWIARGFMHDAVTSIKDAEPREVKKGLKALELPANYPVLSSKQPEDAFFTTQKKLLKPHFTNKQELKAFKEHGGGVVIGEHYKKLPIVLHELGHAEIARSGGLAAYNQEVLRPVGQLVSVASLIASGFGLPLPVKAGLAGLSMLGYVPTLINEHQATSRALQAMEKLRAPKADIAKGNAALTKALSTYYAGALAMPIATLMSLAYFVNKQAPTSS